MNTIYYLFLLIFILAILSAILFYVRRKRVHRRLCHMSYMEKIVLLNDVVAPFGYWYDPVQDIFSCRIDAWQRRYGYRSLYDRIAPFFHMVFVCRPIYFDYDNKTWLVEFWRGQYGITTGSEVGIYHADRILSEKERQSAHFTAASDEELAYMRSTLVRKGRTVGHLAGVHWWLCLFSLGTFSEPDELSLQATILLPNAEMRDAFSEALAQSEYRTQFSLPMRIVRRYALWKNKLFCRLYHFVTRCYTTSLDKVLYLYFFLPFVFRKTLHIRRFRPVERRRH